MTALAGQVLRLNGRPLANVTVQMGEVSTRTDDQGEFLLTGITAGNNRLLVVDGESANRQNARYGRFTFRTNIVALSFRSLNLLINRYAPAPVVERRGAPPPVAERAGAAAPVITFFEREGFEGRSFSTDRPVGNLDRFGFNVTTHRLGAKHPMS